MPALRPILIAACALCACAASGQTVYRCGNSYGTQPCAGGATLDVSDARPQGDALRASKVASDDWKRAEAMEKARLAQEKNAPKALVIGPKESPKPEPKEHGKPKHKKPHHQEEDPNVFTAKGPKQK